MVPLSSKMMQLSKQMAVILACLSLSAPAWSNIEQSLDAVDKLIRMRDYSTAVLQLQSLAKKGDPEAEYRLAGLYRVGKGVARDLDKARDLYLKSARAGHADAQYSLALLIEKSGRSSASRSEARRWYEKSAAQGNRLATVKLERWGKSARDVDLQISQAGVFDAIQHNDEDLIDSLIAKGYDLNLSDAQGNTTVMAAMLAGWPRLTRTLIANTQQFDQANVRGSRPLHLASSRDYEGIVRLLLDKNVDIDQADARGDTALMLAIKNGNIEIARLLLERGARYDLRNQKNKSAVDLAYNSENPESEALFAGLGIEPRAVAETKTAVTLDEFKLRVEQQGARYSGWPLINIAIELGETGITNQIIAQGPDFGASDPDGNHALHVAARKGDTGMLGRLVSAGVNVNATNLRNETALYLATESGCLKCVQLLLKKKADPSIATKSEVTALELAVQKNHSKIALQLLKSDTSYAGIHRVLLLALREKKENLANALIKRDNRLAELDKKKRSVLWHSADQGLVSTTGYLLDTGRFNVNGEDVNGHSALTQAIKNGHVTISRMLIDNRADVSGQTDEGNTMLMLAVLAKTPDMVEYLLTREVELNSRNKLGDTALILAAGSGQNQIVEMLINAGADMQLRNEEDLNAFQIATNAGHEATAKIIHDKSNLIFKIFN